jgi:hypothetical protein
MKLILTTSALLRATGDCGISRDQPCESGIKRDLWVPGLSVPCGFRTKLFAFGDEFPPKSLTHSNDAELEFQSGRANPAARRNGAPRSMKMGTIASP